MTTAPRNAALYCRVSTAKQGKKRDPWHSLPRQKEALLELAVRLGFHVVAVYEEAISGAASSRPQWDAMRGQVEAREVNAVLAVDFTRLTRTEELGEWERVKKELRTAGCIIATLERIYTLEGEEEELSTDIQAAVSKYERLKIRKRTYTARIAAAKAGKFTGHPTPYGYRHYFEGETGRRIYTVVEEEAAAVRRMFELYLAGDEGQLDIAKRLDAEGYPGPGGRPWRRNAVQHILQNPKYAGMQGFKGREVLAPSLDFAPIIPLETWQRAEAIRQRRREGHGPSGPGTPYPLSGILRCPGCGGTLGHKGSYDAPQRGLSRSTYGCQRHKYNNYDACPAPKAYSMVGAHEAVLGFLRAYLPKHLDEARRRELKAAKVPKESPAVRALRQELLDRERQREVLLMKVADEKIDEEDAAFTLASLKRQILDLKGKLAHVDQAADRATRAAGSTEALRPLLVLIRSVDPADRAQLRRAFRESLQEVRIRFVGRHPQNYKRFVYEVEHAILADGHEYKA